MTHLVGFLLSLHVVGRQLVPGILQGREPFSVKAIMLVVFCKAASPLKNIRGPGRDGGRGLQPL